jgi:preprotein translocase subunit SecE
LLLFRITPSKRGGVLTITGGLKVPDLKSTRQEMNFFQRFWNKIQRFIKETVGELRKVSWPTRQEALRLTQIVIIVIFVMAVILGGLDYIYAQIFSVILAR